MSLERSKSKLASVALISALTLVPLGAGVAYLTLPAKAQTAQSPTPPPPPAQGRGWHHPGPGMRGMGPDESGSWGRRSARMDDRHYHGNRQMRLAEKLAAVETAIGIRSDQLDVWRDFTSKLMTFAAPPWQPNVAPNAKGTGKTFDMLDRMVNAAIQRGEAAQQLKDSMQKLEAALTPQQIETVNMLMRPDRGMGMRQGWRHWHRDHMWRGRHDGRGFGPGDRGWGGPAADRPGSDDDQQ